MVLPVEKPMELECRDTPTVSYSLVPLDDDVDVSRSAHGGSVTKDWHWCPVQDCSLDKKVVSVGRHMANGLLALHLGVVTTM